MMDNFGLMDRLTDMAESEFQNSMEFDVFEAARITDPASSSFSPTEDNLLTSLTSPSLDTMAPAVDDWMLEQDPVLNDLMFSDTLIQSEHSYSDATATDGMVTVDDLLTDTSLALLNGTGQEKELFTASTTTNAPAPFSTSISTSTAVTKSSISVLSSGFSNGCGKRTASHAQLDNDPTDRPASAMFVKQDPFLSNGSFVAVGKSHQLHRPPHQHSHSSLSVATGNVMLGGSGALSETKVVVKQEPSPLVIETRRRAQQSLLRPQSAVVLTTAKTTTNGPSGAAYPQVNIKVEPALSFSDPDSPQSDFVDEGLPPTPPTSDIDHSETGAACSSISGSRESSPPDSPVCRSILLQPHHRRTFNPATAVYSQPIPTSGLLTLTEEEKRTLVSEGYPIPSKLPLSKQEEKNLKKVRRKIKNKISAQESRRKKKEYVDLLEKKADDIARENADLRKKVANCESTMERYINEIRRLQEAVSSIVSSPKVQAGTCLMMLALCFTIYVWAPPNLNPLSSYSSYPNQHLYPSGPNTYMTPHWKSPRTLLDTPEIDDGYGGPSWPRFLVDMAQWLKPNWTTQPNHNTQRETLSNYDHQGETISKYDEPCWPDDKGVGKLNEGGPAGNRNVCESDENEGDCEAAGDGRVKGQGDRVTPQLTVDAEKVPASPAVDSQQDPIPVLFNVTV